MKKRPQNMLMILTVVLAFIFIGPNHTFAQDITIVGEINEQNELVSSTDGTIYQLSEDEMADHLIKKNRGEKVKVTGKLIKPVQEISVDELPKGLIEVISFEDVPE